MEQSGENNFVDIDIPITKSIEDQSDSFKDNYVTKVILGSGGLGSVFHIEGPHEGMKKYFAKKTVALNCVEKKKRIQQEYTILKTLNDIYNREGNENFRNVTIRLHAAILTENDFSLVLTYATLGDLEAYLKYRERLSFDALKFVASELVVAVHFLHSNCLIHRDIKPENILLDANRHLLIADFDLAVDMSNGDKELTSVCGTYEYMAPEVANQNSIYSYPADIYSMALTLLSTVCNKNSFRSPLPHNDLSSDQLKLLALQGAYHLSGLAYQRKVCRQFFNFILQKDPMKRPTFEKIKGHSFFAGIDFNLISRGMVKVPKF